MKLIAFHLPQFHPTSENDEWWGKGFTEWTNVTKAKPLYPGHYQPQLPADLGFYDLRLEESRLAQEALAKEYGIYGFCYYHYWFNGKQLLETPINRKLKNPKEDLPFMFCWANENWTRTWDGLDNEVLIQQNYSEQDDLEHIRYLLPIFADPRYIKINGKPIIAIYRSSKLPNPKKTIEIWQNEAQKAGMKLYVCRLDSFGGYGKTFLKPGFDAAIEFQPFTQALDNYSDYQFKKILNNKILLKIKLRILAKLGNHKSIHSINERIRMYVYKNIDYNDYVDFIKSTYKFNKDYVLYPSVTPSWDNTARKGSNSFMLHHANPDKFKEWLQFIKENYANTDIQEKLLFINAWNEWGEGNHLEPCQKWGHKYLQAIKDIFK